MKSALKKTANWFACEGTCYENALELAKGKVKIFDENGNETGEKVCDVIRGRIAMRTDDGIHTFNVYFSSIGGNGKESPRWKMAQSLYEWNPEVNGDSNIEPTAGRIEGVAEINDYVNPQNNKLYSTLRWRVNRSSTSSVKNDSSGASFGGTFYIHKIEEEELNEEPTGRLKITLYGSNRNGECFPVTMFVNEEDVEDFDFNEEETVYFDMNLTSRQVGGANKRQMRHSKKMKVDINSGFSIEELIYMGGSEPIEEPEDEEEEEKSEWIDPDVMKKAIQIRSNKLQNMREGTSTGSNSSRNRKKGLDMKARKEAAKKNRAERKPKPEPEDDDDFPLDDEDIPWDDDDFDMEDE